MRLLRAALLASLGSLLVVSGAGAATITVNSDLDTAPAADAVCTLREAVFVANTNEPTGGRGLGDLGCEADDAGHDTIQLTAGHTYQLEAFLRENANVWGDLDIAGPTTITTAGGGLATIRGDTAGDRDRVIHVLATAGDVTLDRVRIDQGLVNGLTAGDTDAGGGGILADAPVTVFDSEIRDNRVALPTTPAFGGGVYARGPLGSLTMSGTTVAANTMQAGANQVIGAGVAVYGAGSAVSITNSTISGNTSTGNAGVAPGFVGGAFLGDGTASTPSPVDLTSNTITLNTATVGGAASGGLQIANGTMTGNIVAGNTADNNPQDCFGAPDSSGGGNILGKNDAVNECGFTITEPNDLVGTSGSPVLANLGNLLNNGGPTRTHLPNVNSPAIDLGGTCPDTDQRGRFRFNALPCDSGSVEVGASITPPPPSPPPPPPPPATTAAATTGERDAALKKCKKTAKKKDWSKKRLKRCLRKARQLPV